MSQHLIKSPASYIMRLKPSLKNQILNEEFLKQNKTKCGGRFVFFVWLLKALNGNEFSHPLAPGAKLSVAVTFIKVLWLIFNTTSFYWWQNSGYCLLSTLLEILGLLSQPYIDFFFLPSFSRVEKQKISDVYFYNIDIENPPDEQHPTWSTWSRAQIFDVFLERIKPILMNG